MDKITPTTTQAEMPLDQVGATYEAEAVRIYQLIKDKPRKNRYIVSDGWITAVIAEDCILVYAEYRGTDGKFYERLRPANKFETRLLQKIDGLNSFFVE